MSAEIKLNGEPVGILQADEIAFGISNLSWDPYRSFSHLQMAKAFETGSPVFLEVSHENKSIRVRLVGHSPNHIRIERLAEAAITIRQASIDDAKPLTDLAYTTFWDAFAHHPKNAPDDLNHYMRQAFSLEQITSELADEKNIFLLAEIEGELAGYSKLIVDTIEPGITAERPVELSRLYSQQKFLGTGVGKMLMAACLEWAKSNGRDVMWLGVWEFNPRAQRFYGKNGFCVVGKHTFQLGSDPQTDLLMQREI